MPRSRSYPPLAGFLPALVGFGRELTGNQHVHEYRYMSVGGFGVSSLTVFAGVQ